MDSDAIAETVAIAKLMLRKKTREEIIDSSYNRYIFEEEKNDLPVWFAEDEDKHNKPTLPVTREMIDAEKARMREFDVKTPKKVF
jgi:AdoMet-dependent rRNA methyltransferase SPB1